MDVSVGTRLRVLRKDAGLTQAQLAALAGTNQAAINRYETDRQRHLTVFWSGMPPILMYRWIISSACARTPAGGMSASRRRGRRRWYSANRTGASLWKPASRRAAS